MPVVKNKYRKAAGRDACRFGGRYALCEPGGGAFADDEFAGGQVCGGGIIENVIVKSAQLRLVPHDAIKAFFLPDLAMNHAEALKGVRRVRFPTVNHLLSRIGFDWQHEGVQWFGMTTNAPRR